MFTLPVCTPSSGGVVVQGQMQFCNIKHNIASLWQGIVLTAEPLCIRHAGGSCDKLILCRSGGCVVDHTPFA